MDIPIDIKKKIKKDSRQLPDKAKITAVPTNGAVQGVARIVNKQPDKKSSYFL